MNKSNIKFSEPLGCDALVTFTLLRNAEDFIQRRELSIKGLFDLSTLVDSIILHPRILTIKGAIPDEVYPQQIINFLTENKLIRFYQPSYNTRELITMMNQYALFRDLEWYHFSWDLPPLRLRKYFIFKSKELMDLFFVKEPRPLKLSRVIEASTQSRFGDSEIEALINKIKLKNKDLPDDYNLFDIIHLLSTGHHFPFRQYLFRTVVYLCSADYDKLIFYPDYVRIPYVSSCIKRLYSNLSREVYDHIATAFDVNVEEILEDVSGIHLILPPFLYMTLQKMAGGINFFDALLQVRSEFESMRKQLGEIDNTIRNAATIAEKRKGTKQKKELLEAITRTTTKKYGPGQSSLIKESLSFAKDVTDVATNPMNPIAYIKMVLGKPREWIHDWWLKRPVTHLLNTVQRLEELPEIFALVHKVFGYKISSEELKSYQNSKNSVIALMRRYEKPKK